MVFIERGRPPPVRFAASLVALRTFLFGSVAFGMLLNLLLYPSNLLYPERQSMKRVLLPVIIVLMASTATLGQEPGEKEHVYSVPDLNGRAMLLVRPEIPGDVALKEDGTTLTVKVVVDANGDVVSAKCSLACPPEAAGPAQAAA